MFFDGSKFREQFSKTVTHGIILWNYLKIWQAVSEEKNFEESLSSSHSENPPRRPFFSRRIKISRAIFEKGHTRNNPVELFQKKTTQGTFLPSLVQIGPVV